MKKYILMIAIMAIAGMSNNSFAQKRADRPAKMQARTCSIADRRGVTMPLFEGITLTEAQQNQFRALRQSRAEQKQARLDSMKNNDRDGRITSNVTRQPRPQGPIVQKRMRRQQLNDVKSILTPEQYVIYLENFYLGGEPKGKEMMREHKRGGCDCCKADKRKDRHDRGHKHGKKHDRQDKKDSKDSKKELKESKKMNKTEKQKTKN